MNQEARQKAIDFIKIRRPGKWIRRPGKKVI